MKKYGPACCDVGFLPADVVNPKHKESSFRAVTGRFESRDQRHRVRRALISTHTHFSSRDPHPGRHCCENPSSIMSILTKETTLFFGAKNGQ